MSRHLRKPLEYRQKGLEVVAASSTPTKFTGHMKTPTVLRNLAPRIIGLALLTLLATTGIHAEPTAANNESSIPRFAIGAEIGTAGYGPVITFTANKYFTANLGYTFLSYDHDVSDKDVDYTGTLKLSNLQAILNWHPMAGTFHISAGAVLTNNKVDLIGQPKANSTYEIGGTIYTGAQIGRLTGNVELSKGAAPYLGLGWSKSPSASGLGFFFNLGVIFTDSPHAQLSASGPIASNATFQSNLRKEEASVNDELNDFKYYPVVQLGLMYRF